MSMTLGEKLRQAREERGITLSEVAEQTRISPIYLESIDNDDYRKLPGGIFNRGFVKSYAKYVGLDEQEALHEYSRLQNEIESPQEPEIRVYRPEVLTDERAGSSNAPTILMAVIILAVMTGGILLLVNYLRKPSEPAANTQVATNTNANTQPANDNSGPTSAAAADLAASTIEFKAISQPVKVIASVDSEAPKPVTVAGGSSTSFTPKESLTLNYLRWNASAVELTINGKQITLPPAPLDPKDKDRIIFTISKENFAQILKAGSVMPASATPEANPNTETSPQTPETPARTPAPKSTPQANVSHTPKPAETPKTTTPKPVTTPKPPAANKPQ
jgi:cytoskeletal protein RodZ